MQKMQSAVTSPMLPSIIAQPPGVSPVISEASVGGVLASICADTN
ncbi:MAG: hypothetical protein R3E58_08835 [Phycisphaerae bacterium]